MFPRLVEPALRRAPGMYSSHECFVATLCFATEGHACYHHDGMICEEGLAPDRVYK